MLEDLVLHRTTNNQPALHPSPRQLLLAPFCPLLLSHSVSSSLSKVRTASTFTGVYKVWHFHPSVHKRFCSRSFFCFLFSQYSRCSCEPLSTSTLTKGLPCPLVPLLIFLTLEVSFHESTKFDVFCHVARQCSACVLPFLAPRSGFSEYGYLVITLCHSLLLSPIYLACVLFFFVSLTLIPKLVWSTFWRYLCPIQKPLLWSLVFFTWRNMSRLVHALCLTMDLDHNLPVQVSFAKEKEKT